MLHTELSQGIATRPGARITRLISASKPRRPRARFLAWAFVEFEDHARTLYTVRLDVAKNAFIQVV